VHGGGSFHHLDAGTTEREQLAAAHARTLLRAIVPERLSADDPAPSAARVT
jgi:hypothetical protein